MALLLASRRTNREIAVALGMSEHTARHHTESIMRKMGVSSRTEVTVLLGGGVIEPTSGTRTTTGQHLGSVGPRTSSTSTANAAVVTAWNTPVRT